MLGWKVHWWRFSVYAASKKLSRIYSYIQVQFWHSSFSLHMTQICDKLLLATGETNTVTLDMQASSFFFPRLGFADKKHPHKEKDCLPHTIALRHDTVEITEWLEAIDKGAHCNGHGRYNFFGCHIWQCNQHSYQVLFRISNLNWSLGPSVPQILTNVNFVIGAVAANLKWLKKTTTFVHFKNKEKHHTVHFCIDS